MPELNMAIRFIRGIKMPIVTLIRHAETTYNASKIFAGRIDCELSEKGIRDTKNKFNYQKEDFDIYYCSPLKRSIDTLNLMIEGIDKINIDNRIIEISIGDWEGKSKETLPQDLLANYRKGIYTPLHAETIKEVDERVSSFILELFDLFDDDTKILVITHNGVMRSIKRNFVPDYENIMSSNLETIVLDRKNYTYYLNNKKEKTHKKILLNRNGTL